MKGWPRTPGMKEFLTPDQNTPSFAQKSLFLICLDKESEGFFLIQNKYRKILELYGVKFMETAIASDFNADLHEAIAQVPVEDEKMKGKIVEVVEKGYLLQDKVIRFAKVVIGS